MSCQVSLFTTIHFAKQWGEGGGGLNLFQSVSGSRTTGSKRSIVLDMSQPGSGPLSFQSGITRLPINRFRLVRHWGPVAIRIAGHCDARENPATSSQPAQSPSEAYDPKQWGQLCASRFRQLPSQTAHTFPGMERTEVPCNLRK